MNGHHPLQTIIFSITSKCNLSCTHCFEWQNLDSEETLSLGELRQMLKTFREYGIIQVQLSGGEPLCRFDDMMTLVREFSKDMEFWLLTSGVGLTQERVGNLKEAGLTGVNISLDHWDEREHNRFRNFDRAFEWVEKGARHTRKTGLALCLSLCATNEFSTEKNLWKYVETAERLGAGFIRILEARRAGRFTNDDVELTAESVATIENFYKTINSRREHEKRPMVVYPGYHQRIMGCFGAGNRYLYVDSNADLHACPFCQNVLGNALTDPLEMVIDKIRNAGCHKFETISA
jgi:molybdenum cofactor biosynthesis enzyme MoaA